MAETIALDDLEKTDPEEQDERKKKGGAFTVLFCGQCCLILLLLAAIPAVLIALNVPAATSVAADPTPSPTGSPTESPVPTVPPTAVPTAAPVPTVPPTAVPTAAPVPTPVPTTSPTLSPTTPAPTVSPTPSPTRVVSCVISPVSFDEDEGRVQDPGDESVVTINGASKPFTVTVEIETVSAFGALSTLNLASSSLGDVYNGAGSIVTSVPSTSFVESPPGTFELSGLRFLPRADLGAASSTVTHSVTFTRADAGLDTDEPCASVISSCGIADVPEIVSSGGCFNISEGASVPVEVTSLLKDTDDSEAIHRYVLTIPGGDVVKIGSLNSATSISTATEVPPTSCSSNCQTGTLVVSPADLFVGSFGFDMQVRSREKSNACSLAQRFAQSSDTISFSFDVYPSASEPSFAVLDSRVNEDAGGIDIFDQTIIDMSGLDADASETLFLVLFADSLPAGATVEVGGSPVSPNGDGEYVLEEADSPMLVLAANSNEDAMLRVRVRVVDEGTVSNCGAGASTVQDVYDSADAFINLAVKGEADVPVVTGVTETASVILGTWTRVGTTLTTLINEDEAAQLDFSFASGEDGDKQVGDTSETLSAVLVVPSDVVVFNSTLLSFIGASGLGDFLYDIPIDVIPEIYLGRSTEHDTNNFAATIIVVVTEDDGDSVETSFTLQVNIAPVIDAGTYTKSITNPGCTSTQIAEEDTPFELNYLPNLVDPSEVFLSAEISGLPASASLEIDAVPLTPTLGVYTISAADIGKVVILTPESDSDEDLSISTSVVVEQSDLNGEPTATSTITGTVTVDVRAKVETTGFVALLLPGGGNTLSASSDTNGEVDLTTSSSSGKISFIEADGSSAETILGLVIEFPVATGPGFIVDGGIFDGDRTWTVPGDDIGDVKVRALQGFTGTLALSLSANVVDVGDDLTDDSCEEVVTATITVSFATNTFTCTAQNPAAFSIPTALSLSGAEDASYSLSALTTTVSTAGGNQADDLMSVVFTSADLAGASVGGSEEDFVNTNFVQHVPVSGGGVADFTAVSLKPKANFAGDVNIDVTFVNLDTVCGGFLTLTRTILVRVTPVLDASTVEMVLEGTTGLNADELPVSVHGGSEVFLAGVAKEDGVITLTPNLITPDTGDVLEGEESITSITLTVQNPAEGSFLDNATGVTSTAFTGDGDSTFFFVPTAHFSGDIGIDVSASVEDAVTYTLSTPASAIDSESITTSFTITVMPVCDPVTITSGVVVNGAEDSSGISLGDISYSMDDTDGSETLLAFLVKGVPNGFKATPATNLGSAGWRFSPGGGSTLAGLSIVPPADFSGSVDLTLIALAQEELGEEADFCTTTMTFTLVVTPVPDAVQSLIVSSNTGTEGVDVTVTLNAKTADDSVDYMGVSGVTEGGPETTTAILTNVPEGAFVQNISAITATKLSPTSWSVESSENELTSFAFNSGDANGVFAIDVDIISVDNGVTLASPVSGTLNFDITAVNDPPVNTVPGPVSLSGAASVIINGISIEDIDVGIQQLRVELEPVEAGSSLLVYPPSGSGVTVTELTGPDRLILVGTLVAMNELFENGLNYTGTPGNIIMETNDEQAVPGPVGIDTDTIEVVA